MRLKVKKLGLKLIQKTSLFSLKTALALVAAGFTLAVILYPAVIDAALGGILQKIVPAPIYNAIHELRHLLGIPCH